MKFLRFIFAFVVCVFVLSSVILSPNFFVKADTAFLQLDRNEYYETGEVCYNMEDVINTSHLYDFGLNDNHGHMSGLSFIDGYYGEAIEDWSANPPQNVTIPDINIIDEDYTFMFWLYPTSVASYEVIIFSNTASGGTHRIRIDANDKLSFYGGLDVVFSNTSIVINKWVHVACVRESANATHLARIYLNGTFDSAPKAVWRHRHWDTNITIGDDDDGAFRYAFDGKIDEVRIYKGEARTEAEILTDMQTPVALQLTVEDLEANEDVVQLWFENDTLFEQQTADSNGEVEFNVFSFSDRNSTYNGVLNVYHEDLQYEGYVMVLNWGDIYKFTVLGVFADLFTQLFFGTGAWLGLIIVISIALILTQFVKYGSLVFYPILFFFGLGYLNNVSSDSNLLYATVISWVTIPLLLFIEMKQH